MSFTKKAKKVAITTVSVIDKRLDVQKKPVKNMEKNMVLRLDCRSVSTVVGALGARSAVGLKSASTIVYALSARSAVGAQSASTVVGALNARSAAGAQSANTVVSALGARCAMGAQSANTTVNGGIVRSVTPLDT